ncbi:Serpentine Receptor, class H [Caenorhabditis elegans]|uniref:Serpentine Receptor, class H n=1 Tax=Caenorhabditis elegans TaxID=6239 RepID=O61969_CAEEL|nr:Serpentine Receptor, class H [Caenorhabditis elegans]CCD67270.1 Serpentine Receptor, class H [Caenorhabditis elegans]|eukprot:NP_503803.1 Serpentine Receptor, class H [Caenorhabditis elegans]
MNCYNANSYYASPEFLIRVSNVITFFEVPLCIFGAYCILFKTPEKMKSVKWLMMNLHFWSFLSDLTICCFGIPFLHLPHNAGYGLGLIDAPGLMIYCGITFMGAFGVTILAIYENRYYIVFAQNSIWKQLRRIFMPLMWILVPFYFLPPFFQIPDQESARIHIQKEIPCLNLTLVNNRNLFVLSLNSNLVGYCAIMETVVIVSPIILFFFLTLYQFFKIRDSMKFSSKSYQLQKSFLIAITLQSLLSFVFILVPVTIVLYGFVFWYYNQVLNNFMSIMFSLFGLETCVVMILVHRPYREYALSLLLFFRKRTVKKVDCISVVMIH